jgi:hypothetical protein
MKTILIAPYIILLIMISSCTSKNDNEVNDRPYSTPEQITYADTKVVDTSFNVDTNYNKVTVPSVNQVPIVDELEMVNFRVQNTFNNSDKTYTCYITINESTKIMVLRALNGVDAFTLTSEGDGVFSLNFFKSNEHQIMKTVYRRNDLEEDGNQIQIYTSRTGEITLTLSYP